MNGNSCARATVLLPRLSLVPKFAGLSSPSRTPRTCHRIARRVYLCSHVYVCRLVAYRSVFVRVKNSSGISQSAAGVPQRTLTRRETKGWLLWAKSPHGAGVLGVPVLFDDCVAAEFPNLAHTLCIWRRFLFFKQVTRVSLSPLIGFLNLARTLCVSRRFFLLGQV